MRTRSVSAEQLQEAAQGLGPGFQVDAVQGHRCPRSARSQVTSTVACGTKLF